MTVKNKKIIRYVLCIVWLILVCMDIWLSLKPNLSLPVEFNNSDKIYHMVMYLTLALLPFIFFKQNKIASYLAIFCLFLGILLEHGQFFIPSRDFSLGDILANEIGILLGIYLGTKIGEIVNK